MGILTIINDNDLPARITYVDTGEAPPTSLDVATDLDDGATIGMASYIDVYCYGVGKGGTVTVWA